MFCVCSVFRQSLENENELINFTTGKMGKRCKFERCDGCVRDKARYCDKHRDTLRARLDAPQIVTIPEHGRYYFLNNQYQNKINEEGVPVPVSSRDIGVMKRLGHQPSYIIRSITGASRRSSHESLVSSASRSDSVAANTPTSDLEVSTEQN
jgi:hypothetical protein